MSCTWVDASKAIVWVFPWIWQSRSRLNEFRIFLFIYNFIFTFVWESTRRKRLLWMKVLKTFVNFRQTAPSSCLSGSSSRHASADINCYSALRFPNIKHTVLKYLHSQFCLIGWMLHYSQRVSHDVGRWQLCLPTIWPRDTAAASLEVQRSAACTVRMTNHTEIY